MQYWRIKAIIVFSLAALLLMQESHVIFSTKETVDNTSRTSTGFTVEDAPSAELVTENILLFSVGRSGSSIFGEFLHRALRPSLYWFEPLWSPFTLMRIPTSQKMNVSLATMRSLFSCDPQPEAVPFLSQLTSKVKFFQMSYNQSRMEFKDPIAFENVCRNATVKIAKCVRFNELPISNATELVRNLINEFKTLKIILLMRDARRVALSARKQKSFANWTAGEVCGFQSAILQTVKRIVPPNRYLVVKYEDMYHSDRRTTARMIIKKLGYTIDSTTLDWVTCNFVEKTPKPSKHWQVQGLNDLNNSCSELFPLLGYNSTSITFPAGR